MNRTNADLARAYRELNQAFADAVRLIQLAADHTPYYGCFSGGKDSTVLKHIVKLASVPATWHFHMSGIDPPELLLHIRQYHADVQIHRPSRSFFALARELGLPSRKYRWCCRLLKEKQLPRRGRLLMGVRADESPRRAKTWRPLTWHHHAKLWTVCPLYTWTAEQIWLYIHNHSLPYCHLYDQGFTRIGCIGCPLASASDRQAALKRWPSIAARWKELCRQLWVKKYLPRGAPDNLPAGQSPWRSADDLYNWYIGSKTDSPELCGAEPALLTD